MEYLMIKVMLMKINKNITLDPLFKNYKKTIIYSLKENSEGVLVFEGNNAGLKKLSTLCEQKSD
jgi:hypothetical protein